MDKTCLHLLSELNPAIVYTQSDEITLIWLNEETNNVLPFKGRYQKWCSTIASSATLFFNRMADVHMAAYAHLEPTFDCRVWQVPNTQIAAQNLLWRELDATKNSVSMAASSKFSHKELDGVSTRDRMIMLEGIGVIWGNYPERFKKGAYFQKEERESPLTQDILDKIPVDRRPENGVVIRHVPMEISLPKLTSIENYEQVLFYGAEPIFEVQT
jgi:tRNA(His) 5'-end guanylyltransferase